jgi:NitT/TauT family transport system substrate-binding protein
MRRGRLLGAGFAAVGALAFGAAPDVRLAASAAAVPGRARVRLGYLGNPCEAITFAAPSSAIFHRHKLAAQLVPYPSEDALIKAVSAGTIDAASMNLPALMRPLEAAPDVRVVAGLHAGCLRVVAPDDVIVRTFGNLKGAHIATDRLHGPSMNLLSALLRRQGIDPRHDVSWHVYPIPDLEAALAAKSVDCVAASDPLGYLLLVDKSAEPYINTADGGFSCGAGIGNGHHCFLIVHGRLVENRPALAESIARAYLESSAELAHGVGPAALAEVRGGYTFADLHTSLGILSSYDWSASTDFVLEELELTARDFRRAGLLKATTDPEQLADRAYANVLGA